MSDTSTISKAASIKSSVIYEDPIHVGPRVEIHGGSIGRYAFINADTIIYDNVRIGRFVTFARNCQIGGVEHPIHYLSTSFFRISPNWFPNDPLSQNSIRIRNTRPPNRTRDNSISIGNDVWFGAGAIVLKGVRVGDGAVIGAGAVVTRDIEPYSIVAGNPARPIRKRFDESTIDRLLCAKWWDRDPEFIATLPMNDIEKSLAMLEAL
ncbi:CatB-related O-acetyltransferase [Brevundimonas diminuta]|uniref:CatB-related O-acetyltransferase n=1 Tax=Brevundimonas diminuta TaxID=293 RepID=UPI003D34D2C2